MTLSLEDFAIEAIRQANQELCGSLRMATLHEPTCKACHPLLGYVCTRPRGHDGEHAAHGLLDEVVQIWPANPDPVWQSTRCRTSRSHPNPKGLLMKARVFILGIQSMGGCWFCHPDCGYSNYLSAENALDDLRAKDPGSKGDRIFEVNIMNQDYVHESLFQEAIDATEFSPRKDRIIMAKEAYAQGRTHDAVVLLLAATHARSPA